MRAGQPSHTAALVAAARGLAGVDPCAEALLPGRLAALVRAGRGGGAGDLALCGFDAALGGLVRHLGLRTLAIDAALCAALRGGGGHGPADQVVLLGCGLDTRPWRLPALAGARLFEVDHPATAAWRRRRAAALGPARAERRLVEVDFGRDPLDAALLRAGLDPRRRAVWLWEGVTMYLPPAATRATLDAIAALSPPGAALLLTYMEPLPALPALARAALHGGFAALGEPLLGVTARAAMAEALRQAGFAPRELGNNRAWALRHGRWRAPLAYRVERLLAGARQAPGDA
jgi:methyltransferase (TIGR00027 family)